MLESFSVQAVKIIEDAKKLALELNCEVVGSEHLLLSMYQTPDSICRFLLEEKNITYTNLIDTLNNITVIHKKENSEIIFTDKFQEIILKSEELVKELGSKHVFDEHIFYSMLEDGSNVGIEILTLMNLNIDELMDDIEDIFNFFTDESSDMPYPYLINLSTKEKLHPYIERENYIDRINYILDKKQKNNPLLIGSAGVGKTAIVEGLALIRKDDIFYQLDLGGTIAGTKYRGELEDKILKAMEYAKEQNAILFIDEIHNVVGAGSNDGSLDIANILKPYLSRNDISIIGATTLEEYYKFIEKDKALMRRFQPVFISEPTLLETKTILMGIKSNYEDYHNITISEQDIDKIIDKTSIYIPQRTFPDKAIDVLDEIGARKKYNKYKDSKTSDLIDIIIKDQTNINVIGIEELRKLDLNYNNLKSQYLKFIERTYIYPNIFSCVVNEDFNPKYLINDLEKVFNFKHEMFLEIDLNNYNDSTMINNLIGSSKGYIGYEQGGILSEHIIKYPMSLIYFKNYNKAHISVINLLDKIMKTSYFIDNKGRKINLQNTMFIYNLGINKQQVGFIDNKINNKDNRVLPTINKKETNNKIKQLLNKYQITITNIDEININEYENIIYKLLLIGTGSYKIVDKNNYINT